MKLIATSEIPTRVPYIHFAYLAADGREVAYAFGCLFVFIIGCIWLLRRILNIFD